VTPWMTLRCAQASTRPAGGCRARTGLARGHPRAAFTAWNKSTPGQGGRPRRPTSPGAGSVASGARPASPRPVRAARECPSSGRLPPLPRPWPGSCERHRVAASPPANRRHHPVAAVPGRSHPRAGERLAVAAVHIPGTPDGLASVARSPLCGASLRCSSAADDPHLRRALRCLQTVDLARSSNRSAFSFRDTEISTACDLPQERELFWDHEQLKCCVTLGEAVRSTVSRN
jgi:hypothetical protein